jgi:hypothetical protein
VLGDEITETQSLAEFPRQNQATISGRPSSWLACGGFRPRPVEIRNPQKDSHYLSWLSIAPCPTSSIGFQSVAGRPAWIKLN